MDVDYSKETLQLGRRSFRDWFQREPDDAELTEFIDSLLQLGLAMIK